MEESLSKAVKRLQKYIYTLPQAKQLNVLSGEPRKAMIHLRNSIDVAQVSIVIYETSDDTKEKAVALERSIEHIIATNDAIVAASQYDLLGSVDVAHLSALTEHIKERLQ